MWELYLDPEWVRQRLRLYGAQDRALAQFFKKVRCSLRGVALGFRPAGGSPAGPVEADQGPGQVA
ncbi:hypothetical protein HaLaN_06446 [Haematococcus lacustris]|uniref:Uncharacterized protein n=1 Tax=Haematococcus lacustris TaxID=44745 RepID=A0A699Z6B9_HAELA|nr:hypothetical protein HaLaN_06446 [Haematococcus lacustris]